MNTPLPQHHFSGSLSRPISPTKPTPKSMPTAVRLTMSAPCNAAMRGLPRSDSSTITPVTASTKPVIRLDFRIHHCGRSPVLISPQPEMQP
jgi:hypothetical protein